MADGAAVLDRQIARLRELGGAMPELTKRIALEVERELRAQIARGMDPYGNPWPLTKDGHQPLQHAARALSVRAVGTSIVVTIDGVEARHHLGAVKGGVRRQVIPTGAIPEPLARAISRVVDEAFRKTMGVA